MEKRVSKLKDRITPHVTNFFRLRLTIEEQEGKRKYKSDGAVMVGEFVCMYVCSCTVSEWECEWVMRVWCVWVRDVRVSEVSEVKWSEWVGEWVSAVGEVGEVGGEVGEVGEVGEWVSECEWMWVSVSECEWVWVNVSECEWVWVSVKPPINVPTTGQRGVGSTEAEPFGKDEGIDLSEETDLDGAQKARREEEG